MSSRSDVPQGTHVNHLGSGNFTIGQDFSVTKDTLHSVFKKEYPNHGNYGRADLAKPPRLGDVMHADHHFNKRESETATSFEYRFLKKPVLFVSCLRLLI